MKKEQLVSFGASEERAVASAHKEHWAKNLPEQKYEKVN